MGNLIDPIGAVVGQADGGPSDVVSPHVELGAGVAAIVSFTAAQDGASVTAVKAGGSVHRHH